MNFRNVFFAILRTSCLFIADTNLAAGELNCIMSVVWLIQSIGYVTEVSCTPLLRLSSGSYTLSLFLQRNI
jgi:hypothetical protein